MELRLTLESRTLARRTFQFSGPRSVVIGRSSDCDIEVFDERVSRRQCVIHFDGQSIQVKDLDSANGTLVNGRLARFALLNHGDVLGLGELTVHVELTGPDGTVRLTRTERASARQPAALRDPSLRIAIPGFELAGVLGEGVTSAVFEARHVPSGDVVAIKVLKLADSLVNEERERFLREAATAARLLHPNVVRILGHGAAGRRLYIVMEFVRGETVRARIAREGPLPLPVALHVACQIASALDYARSLDIVHRDVKPENILVQEDGVARLVDFGLAKPVTRAGALGPTRAGDVLGTLAYMSPEQLESSVSADHRSDIYSLGATLHHMIAGATPLSAETNVEYFEKIRRHVPPPLALLRSDVPPIVSAMVARCLEKQPSARYERAEEIARIVGPLLESIDEQLTAF